MALVSVERTFFLETKGVVAPEQQPCCVQVVEWVGLARTTELVEDL
jgi:hypothetical protein